MTSAEMDDCDPVAANRTVKWFSKLPLTVTPPALDTMTLIAQAVVGDAPDVRQEQKAGGREQKEAPGPSARPDPRQRAAEAAAARHKRRGASASVEGRQAVPPRVGGQDKALMVVGVLVALALVVGIGIAIGSGLGGGEDAGKVSRQDSQYHSPPQATPPPPRRPQVPPTESREVSVPSPRNSPAATPGPARPAETTRLSRTTKEQKKPETKPAAVPAAKPAPKPAVDPKAEYARTRAMVDADSFEEACRIMGWPVGECWVKSVQGEANVS